MTKFYLIYFLLLSSCKEQDQYAQGCTSVSTKPFQMELTTALDPARDLQRLHSLIIANVKHFEILNDSNLQAFNPGQCDDPPGCRRTLQKLGEIAFTLEQIHRKYKGNLARDMKYGSRHAPIGDDNYLHMIRGALNTSSSGAIGNNLTTSHVSQIIDKSPNFFNRHHFLRSSDSERYSQS